MIDDMRPGAGLNRDLIDVRKVEKIEADLDQLISRRDRERRETEGDRKAEEAWQESVRRFHEQRRQQARVEWHLHHVDQAERLRRTLEGLVEYHEKQAEKLTKGAA